MTTAVAIVRWKPQQTSVKSTPGKHSVYWRERVNMPRISVACNLENLMDLSTGDPDG
jgi:hypothetical protein